MAQDKRLLLVTYTLYPPEQDEDLVAKLEKADSYEIDETSWLVCTVESAGYWYGQLERVLFPEDELTIFQIDVKDVAAPEGIKEDIERWVKSRFG